MENLGLKKPFHIENQIDRDFWRDRRVFLTGHTGFKGSWLSLWLIEMGAQLTGYALAPLTTPNMFELVDVAQKMTSLLGDIRDREKVTKAIHATKPEIIIHMAAQPLVRTSYDDPIGTYATNVMGTAHILDAVRTCPSVRAVLVVTSDKCYENREWVWGYRENEAMGGYDPYSSSKGCAELVMSAYRRSYFHPTHYDKHRVAIASARAGNVIGGGDWAADRLVPDAMRAFMSHTALTIRNPFAIRPWQHVLDPLMGYIQLCQQLVGKNASQFADAWNFGPHSDSECTVEHVLSLLIKEWGQKAEWKHIDKDKSALHEAHYLRLDCSKANSMLGWHPQNTLPEALQMTAEWYKTYQDKGDLRALSLNQIDHIVHQVQTKSY